jgi:hypothetical protein
MTKFIGKPYAGKSHVRFDEGAGVAISLLLALLYWLIKIVLSSYHQRTFLWVLEFL